MKGYRMSKLHLGPIHKIKVRKVHYKTCLGVASLLILVVHIYWPAYESHVAVAVNLLFVIDPTV